MLREKDDAEMLQHPFDLSKTNQLPRGSKYPIFEVSGSKSHNIPFMVFGTRDLNYWYVDPLGFIAHIRASSSRMNAARQGTRRTFEPLPKVDICSTTMF